MWGALVERHIFFIVFHLQCISYQSDTQVSNIRANKGFHRTAHTLQFPGTSNKESPPCVF